MAYTQKDGEGALWPVDPEKKKPNGPNATGSFTLDGVKYRIVGWRKLGKDGRPDWMSLAIQPQERRGGGRSDSSDDEGSIPF